MEKILVDQGSYTKIMYYKAFMLMGLDQDELVESITPLIEFSSDAVWPIMKVTLNVRAGSVVLPTDFLVVDVPFSYNAIIGRTWPHRVKEISSTYHK